MLFAVARQSTRTLWDVDPLTLLYLVVLGGPVVAVVVVLARHKTTMDHATRDGAQDTIEARMIELWVEFPDLTAEAIAMITRDELVNRQVKNHAMFNWATPDTAARVLRTLKLRYLRGERAAIQAATVSVAEAPPTDPFKTVPVVRRAETTSDGVVIVRPKQCSKCHASVRGDALKCPKCGHWFPLTDA